MSRLENSVRIAGRFQRSVNIAADIGSPSALEGFICPQSSQHLLMQMADHISKTNQSAFTWTGPYGSGKSSLAVALAGILSGSEKIREANATLLGNAFANSLWSKLPPRSKGWKVIPVVGRRADPLEMLGQAISESKYLSTTPKKWTATNLIAAIDEISSMHPRSSGGLILFIDEMGKFLEAAARDDYDIYLFQELAEAASRSKGRIVLIGVLHQSFSDYANRLSRELRDEWSKIQGRYVDLVVDSTGLEQLELISRAIESDKSIGEGSGLVDVVATQIAANTGISKASLGSLLEGCWPLHPIVARMLGPISRRRFGQNQRSIFGFLNSAEPFAFQQFIATGSTEDLYFPALLWDYLRTNLEPAILASPDGHRWSMAAEALERCDGLSTDEHTISLLKCISLIDLFKESSGLRASHEILLVALPGLTKSKLNKSLGFLKQNSLIVFRKFQNAYGVYAGSDFDIEVAFNSARSEIGEVNLETLYKIADIHPILAKRHYHETGALRWFDVGFSTLRNIGTDVEFFQPTSGAVGQVLVVIPTEDEQIDGANDVCRSASNLAKEGNVIVGLPANGHEVGQLALDLIALDHVKNNSPELAGDAVARREVSSRLSMTQQALEEAIQSAFESSSWYLGHERKRKNLSHAELNKWVSACCSDWFSESPIIINELLNRRQPSSSAIAGQNHLLRYMVTNRGLESLGIEGFPAEAGLLHSILINTGLYTCRAGTWEFASPKAKNDRANVGPMFESAFNLLKFNKSTALKLGDIYNIWRSKPFGVAEGLLPTLAVAFILVNSKCIAFYRDGLFRSEISDLDVDILTKDENGIQLRWMDLTGNSKKLLSGLATIIQTINPGKEMIHLQPIDVARELVAIHETLPGWVKRTQKLSANTLQVRRLLNQARDPNKFLFGDLPRVLQEDAGEFENQNISQMIESLSDCILEMTGAYTNLIARLKDLLLRELDIPIESKSALSELRLRAKNIEGVAGDFLIEAFQKRVADFDGSARHIESIASMAANKPTRDWVDQDVQKAMLEIAAFCRAFCRAESYAHVYNRVDKRQAMSVVVPSHGGQSVLTSNFDIMDSERSEVDKLKAEIETLLSPFSEGSSDVILASLTEIIADRLSAQTKPKDKLAEGKAA